MLLNLILLAVGFYMLIKGADMLVDGASSLACIFKIPTIIVGLVIVSFGTSAPEAAISITAGLSGSNAIAVSNVVGSNIFNLLLVLGVSAMIISLPVPNSIIRNEFPLLIAFSIVVTILSFIGGSLSRWDGLILFSCIVAYLVWLIKDALAHRAKIEVKEPQFNLSISLLFLFAGLICIIVGGDLVVDSAKFLALQFGMSERLVGLTIVSVGTSLPELVTSVVAARKGNVDIAVGNTVGSSIFNLMFILGLSSMVTPIYIEPVLYIDMIIMIGVTILTYYFSKTRASLEKKEGMTFVMLFVVYLLYIIIRN